MSSESDDEDIKIIKTTRALKSAQKIYSSSEIRQISVTSFDGNKSKTSVDIVEIPSTYRESNGNPYSFKKIDINQQCSKNTQSINSRSHEAIGSSNKKDKCSKNTQPINSRSHEAIGSSNKKDKCSKNTQPINNRSHEAIGSSNPTNQNKRAKISSEIDSKNDKSNKTNLNLKNMYRPLFKSEESHNSEENSNSSDLIFEEDEGIDVNSQTSVIHSTYTTDSTDNLAKNASPVSTSTIVNTNNLINSVNSQNTDAIPAKPNPTITSATINNQSATNVNSQNIDTIPAKPNPTITSATINNQSATSVNLQASFTKTTARNTYFSGNNTINEGKVTMLPTNEVSVNTLFSLSNKNPISNQQQITTNQVNSSSSNINTANSRTTIQDNSLSNDVNTANSRTTIQVNSLLNDINTANSRTTNQVNQQATNQVNSRTTNQVNTKSTSQSNPSNINRNTAHSRTTKPVTSPTNNNQANLSNLNTKIPQKTNQVNPHTTNQVNSREKNEQTTNIVNVSNPNINTTALRADSEQRTHQNNQQTTNQVNVSNPNMNTTALRANSEQRPNIVNIVKPEASSKVCNKLDQRKVNINFDYKGESYSYEMNISDRFEKFFSEFFKNNSNSKILFHKINISKYISPKALLTENLPGNLIEMKIEIEGEINDLENLKKFRKVKTIQIKINVSFSETKILEIHCDSYIHNLLNEINKKFKNENKQYKQLILNGYILQINNKVKDYLEDNYIIDAV